MGPDLMPTEGHASGDHLYDSAYARPVRLDTIPNLISTHLPDSCSAMLFALQRCGEKDVALAVA